MANVANQSQGPTGLTLIQMAEHKFVQACEQAQSLAIVNNFSAAFTAVKVVKLLREAMTDDVMKEVFMPLMNTKVGFLTDKKGKDKNGNPAPTYPISVVRDAIIDGVSFGLLPTGNQINIIAERMYPTKEGYTALLKKIGCKYFINVGAPTINQSTADVNCKVNFEYNGEKNSFLVVANVKKDDYSSIDQIKGKAERRAKKALYEYITGCDLGDTDPDGSETVIENGRKVEDAQIIDQGEPTVEAKPSGGMSVEQAPAGPKKVDINSL